MLRAVRTLSELAVMGAIEVECPECRRRLRLSDDHGGKSVRCPACRCIFGIRNILSAAGTDSPQPQPNRLTSRTGAGSPRRRSKPRRTETQDPWEALPDEDVFGGGLSSYGDAELAEPWDDSDETPRRRRRTRSRLDLTKVVLFLLMGVIGLGAVGGVGYAIWQFLPRGGFAVFGNAVDLTYMPTNTEAFIHVEMSRVLNAPAVQTLLNASPAVRTALTGATTGTELRLEDIESLTFGIWNKSGQSGLAGAAGTMRFPAGADDSELPACVTHYSATGRDEFRYGEGVRAQWRFLFVQR
jgi:nitrate reductase NapE component